MRELYKNGDKSMIVEMIVKEQIHVTKVINVLLFSYGIFGCGGVVFWKKFN